MTGRLDHWFRAVSHQGLPQTAYAAAMLNHVVVGILLLPLGLALLLLGKPAARGEPEARIVLAGATLAVIALPVVVWRTATPAMLGAPAFLAAVVCLSVGAVLTLASLAVILMTRTTDAGRRESGGRLAGQR
jgi:hypothetical protein